jgi:D-glycero-beta-D-manno-heptose-7-phosphate kinase
MKNLVMASIFKVLEKFDQQEITVVGDLMLDRYIFGEVHRISPEAPVPIVNVKEEKSVPGGAANVALNLVKMQAKSILGGIIGKDADGDELIIQLKQHDVTTDNIIQSPQRSTIKKVRINGHHQNLLRIDYEDVCDASQQDTDQLFQQITKSINSQYIIISDYAKGSITPALIQDIILWASKKGVKVIIDPKPVHQPSYKGCHLMTPNQKEAQEMTGIKIINQKTLEQCGRKLMSDNACQVVITLGEAGMAVFDDQANVYNIPTRAREVYDVSGAGDTVVAAITLSLSAGASLKEAAEIANCAAGIKVSKVGTHPVSWTEINNFLKVNK